MCIRDRHGSPRHRGRAVANHLASGLGRYDVHRHRRVHSVPLGFSGTRECLQPARELGWCAADDIGYSCRRNGGRYPIGWMDGLRQFIRTLPHTIDEIDRMLTKNGIWVGRTIGLGVMTPEEAINWGLSGPMLR